MPADVDITIGADSSQFSTGMAAIRGEVTKVGQSVTSALGGLIAPATLVASAITVGIKGIIDFGDRISDMSKRFHVGTTELQQFGEVAERNGSSLDGLAKAFNRLDVSLAQARSGNKELQKALENLNVANWADKSLTLSQAMLQIGTSAMEANDVVKVLGKSGTELRETLSGLANGTEQLGSAIDPEIIAKLDKWSDKLKDLGRDSRVAGANILDLTEKLYNLGDPSRVLNALRSGFNRGGGGNLADIVGLGSTRENAATNENLIPVGPELEQINDQMDRLTQVVAEEEKARLAALDTVTKLSELESQRLDLQAELNQEIMLEGEQTDRALDLREQIAQITQKIIPLEQQVTAEKARQADEEERAARAAADVAAEEERRAAQARAERDAAAAAQIRDAAGALAFYNLRVGNFAPTYSINDPRGGPSNYGPGGTLNSAAINTLDRINALFAQSALPGTTVGQVTFFEQQIRSLATLLERQILELASIDQKLTPKPGGTSFPW